MIISRTAEYALRAVVWLASRGQTPSGTLRIARATRVPSGYLCKVLRALNRSGLVVSHSGRKGGYRLARRPAEISVLDVVNAVAPVQRITKCPLGLESHRKMLCSLHRRLDRAIALVEQALAQSTIEELLTETTDGKSLPDVWATQTAGRNAPTGSAARGGRPGPKRRQSLAGGAARAGHEPGPGLNRTS